MADATTPTPKKKRWHEIAKDIAISLGLDVAVAAFTKKVMEKGAEKVEHKVFRDQRAELLEELRQIDQVSHADIANLLRRHRESIAKLQENKFVDLLVKICPVGDQGRKPMLVWLNSLDDETFDQMLYFLDHDVVLQWLERIKRNGYRIVKQDVDALRDWASRMASKAKEGCSNGFHGVETAAEKATPHLRSFADRLKAERMRGGR